VIRQIIVVANMANWRPRKKRHQEDLDISRDFTEALVTVRKNV